MIELKKKTVWVAPDGFETDDENKALRYVAETHIHRLIGEYLESLDFSNYRQRARVAQTTIATHRIMDFLKWAIEEDKISLNLSGKTTTL